MLIVAANAQSLGLLLSDLLAFYMVDGMFKVRLAHST